MAQDFAFEQLTIEHGLSQNSVSCLIEDHRGYLWFGTQDGLNKYDGYGFTVYQHIPHVTASLAQNEIMALWEDPQGQLWVGTPQGGLSRFDPSKEVFTHYPLPGRESLAPKFRSISAINIDRRGTMWIGNWEGELRQFDPLSGTYSAPIDLGYHQYSTASGDAIHDAILCIYKDRLGTLWIGNTSGLHQLVDTKSATPRFIHYSPQHTDHSSNTVSSIFEDRAGVLWIGTDKGLFRMERHTGQFVFHPFDSIRARESKGVGQNAIAEDKTGNLWIGTSTAGIYKLNPERTRFSSYRHQPKDPATIGSDQIGGLLVDRSGLLWMGSPNAGIFKFDIGARHIRSYQHNPFDASSLSDNDITAICQDKHGQIWVGTHTGGINRLKKKSGTFAHYVHDPADPASLPGNSVSAMFVDKKGTFWVATQKGHIGGIISLFDRQTGTFHPLAARKAGAAELGGDRVFTFYEDRQGLLWLGTTNGVKSFDQRTGEIKHYRHDPNNLYGISDYAAIAIFEDSRGNLWVGSRSVSLNKLDKRTGRFTHYKPVQGDTSTLPSAIVQCIYEDSRGNLWFGTKSGGLCRFNYQRQTFITYTQRDGLPGNSVYAILEDAHGNLLLGTNNGLSRFAPATKTFTAFNERDGLQSNQVIGSQPVAACLKARDGWLYFGGINGLNALHPSRLSLNRYIPPVVITQFRMFDHPVPGRREDSSIHLQYNENFFTFQFSALSYRNSQKNRYAYQLVGVDPVWVYCGTRREASYTNVSPGTYIFRVKAANNDGLWNEKGTQVMLVIHPPLWQTWWAYTLYGLMVCLSLVGYIRFRIRRERERQAMERQQWEAQQLKNIETLKTRFFSNITHELRTPLSLILAPTEQLLREVVEPHFRQHLSLIRRQARQLLQLINQLLDLSKLEAGHMSINSSRGDIAHFIDQCIESFRYSAREKDIELVYYSQLNQRDWVFDCDKLERIVVNLLSNAIKFTPNGGNVSVSLALKETETQDPSANKWLQLTVCDTGIGIAPDHLAHIFDRFYQVDAATGSGVGLSLVKELVTLLGGQINVTSQAGNGTLFRVTLLLEQVDQHCTQDNAQLPLLTTPTPPEPKLPAIPASDSERSAPDADAPVVLVIEDHAELRAFIANELACSYRTLTAANGREGWLRIQQELPEVVISDVMMPGLDGYELTQCIKTNPVTNHIAVILLTAKTAYENKLSGLAHGADQYLTKPFYSQELLLCVGNLLNHQRKLRQHYHRELAGAGAGYGNLPPSVKPALQDTFLAALYSAIEAQLDNAQFDVDQLAQAVALGRRTLYRKLSITTGLTPNEIIRLYRLKRATDFLKAGYPIAQVAYQVGFESPSYFSQSFKEIFHLTPSDYRQQQMSRSG